MFVFILFFFEGCSLNYEADFVHQTYLGDGVFQTTLTSEWEKKITTGFLDVSGEHTGQCIIKHYSINMTTKFEKYQGYEIVDLKNGHRDGKSAFYYENGSTSTNCYERDIVVPCNKSATLRSSNATAFNILKMKYPWYYNEIMQGNGRESSLRAYMDTIEAKLDKRTVDELKFDNSYNSVLTETNKKAEFDTIRNIISSITKFSCPEILKRDPFRLAAIDHYRSGKTIYKCVETTYAGYLKTMNENKIANPDFQEFCRVVDSLMTGYGTINLSDPMVLDTIDFRLYRAVNYVYSGTKSAMIGASLRGVLNDSWVATQIYSTPKDVSKVVVNLMYAEITEADKVYYAVRESYFSRKNWALLPTLTTVFSKNNSPAGVTIRGNLIETGGAAVTAKGIVWATTYNPTVTDFIVSSSGTGTGEYFANITGLSAGVTYYARAFATNSKGTAYGNVVSFNTTTTSIPELFKTENIRLVVFPNPASNVVTFRFRITSPADYQLTLYNLAGQSALSVRIGHFESGEFTKTLDLNGLMDGAYTCVLTDGRLKAESKLIIKH